MYYGNFVNINNNLLEFRKNNKLRSGQSNVLCVTIIDITPSCEPNQT